MIHGCDTGVGRRCLPAPLTAAQGAGPVPRTAASRVARRARCPDGGRLDPAIPQAGRGSMLAATSEDFSTPKGRSRRSRARRPVDRTDHRVSRQGKLTASSAVNRRIPGPPCCVQTRIVNCYRCGSNILTSLQNPALRCRFSSEPFRASPPVGPGVGYAAPRAPWPPVTVAVLANAATSPRAICTGLASGLVAR
jgi:hypothetical protein